MSTSTGGTICRVCLDTWDGNGPDYYGGMAVHVVVIVDGTSLCIKHYRERRDGTAPGTCGAKPVGACTKPPGHEGGHRYREAP